MQYEKPAEESFNKLISNVLENSKLPKRISSKIQKSIEENHTFINEVSQILLRDPYLWTLIDKENSISEDYKPQDLMELKNSSFQVNRNDLSLRKEAAASLEEMGAAARAEKLTLLVSSAYRTYLYQADLYSRNVKNMGQKAADKVSARPGHSQHQLGLAVDFGSVTNDFSKTREGIWIAKNASRFGWSLSYPGGMEEITGYSWESWHYRYVGKELAALIDSYFEGIQQYALQFFQELTQQK
ncbi:MAG: M15 family metallopeptidase [Treponema sp.]|nr:M15 family metallopeptidase [Treponema sp.]